MTNFERIKMMDKADLIDFIVDIKDHCADGCCTGCPLQDVPNECYPTEVLRWLESDAGGNEPQEPILKIVRVQFVENATKTYDYEWVGNGPVYVGDTVRVETPHQDLKEAIVMSVFEIPESQAEFDYKLAVERIKT